MSDVSPSLLPPRPALRRSAAPPPHQLRGEPVHNALLAALQPDSFHLLGPWMIRIRIVPDQTLVEQGEPAEHVYFVESGIVAMRCSLDGGSGGPYVSLAGSEGMAGVEALLQASRPAPASQVVLLPGRAIRMPTEELRRAAALDGSIERACTSASAALLGQATACAASNAQHATASRLSRLLLLMLDRVEGNVVPVTQEVLSALLDVRRASVTAVLSAWQRAGALRVARGRITVLNRALLEHELAAPAGR